MKKRGYENKKHVDKDDLIAVMVIMFDQYFYFNQVRLNGALTVALNDHLKIKDLIKDALNVERDTLSALFNEYHNDLRSKYLIRDALLYMELHRNIIVQMV